MVWLRAQSYQLNKPYHLQKNGKPEVMLFDSRDHGPEIGFRVAVEPPSPDAGRP